MTYNPLIHHRRSIRLQGYDYRQPGDYFFTSCVKQRRYIFGDVIDGQMCCNDFGKIVWAVWSDLPNHYPYLSLDEFIVMPNHIHGILVVNRYGEQPMWEGIKAVKSTTSSQINDLLGTPGAKFWQRNYWEHIIRDGFELERIRQYIRNNPKKWKSDRNHLNQGKRRKEPTGWDEM